MRLFCTQCGHENEVDSSFCEACGKPLALLNVSGEGGPPPGRHNRWLRISVVALLLTFIGIVTAVLVPSSPVPGVLAKTDTETKTNSLSALRDFFMGSRTGTSGNATSLEDRNQLLSSQGKAGLTPENSLSNKRTILPSGGKVPGSGLTNEQSTAAATVSQSRATSGDFTVLRCDHGFLATVAVAAKEPLGLPNDDAFKFGGNGQMPGVNQATFEAVGKSNAVRLAKEAIVFARKNRAAANCRLEGLPPIVSEIVLIFKDRIPEKVPTLNKDTAASVPGLLVYAEYGIGDTWHLYNIGYQREKIEAEKRKDEALKTVLFQFIKKHDLLLKKEPKGLYANPFAFEGDRLFLVVGFEQMQSGTTGLFYLPNEGILVVNDIPKGAFIQKGKTLLAAKVLGNVKFDGVVGGLVPVHGMVPNLKFLGALICRDGSCDQMDEK